MEDDFGNSLADEHSHRDGQCSGLERCVWCQEEYESNFTPERREEIEKECFSLRPDELEGSFACRAEYVAAYVDQKVTEALAKRDAHWVYGLTGRKHEYLSAPATPIGFDGLPLEIVLLTRKEALESAIREERERCAKVCDERAAEHHITICTFGHGGHWLFKKDECEFLAALIRKKPSDETSE